MAKKSKTVNDVDLAELVKDTWSVIRPWVASGHRSEALAEFLFALERHGLDSCSDLEDQWPE